MRAAQVGMNPYHTVCVGGEGCVGWTGPECRACTATQAGRNENQLGDREVRAGTF